MSAQVISEIQENAVELTGQEKPVQAALALGAAFGGVDAAPRPQVDPQAGIASLVAGFGVAAAQEPDFAAHAREQDEALKQSTFDQMNLGRAIASDCAVSNSASTTLANAMSVILTQHALTKEKRERATKDAMMRMLLDQLMDDMDRLNDQIERTQARIEVLENQISVIEQALIDIRNGGTLSEEAQHVLDEYEQQRPDIEPIDRSDPQQVQEALERVREVTDRQLTEAREQNKKYDREREQLNDKIEEVKAELSSQSLDEITAQARSATQGSVAERENADLTAALIDDIDGKTALVEARGFEEITKNQSRDAAVLDNDFSVGVKNPFTSGDASAAFGGVAATSVPDAEMDNPFAPQNEGAKAFNLDNMG